MARLTKLDCVVFFSRLNLERYDQYDRKEGILKKTNLMLLICQPLLFQMQQQLYF